MNWRRWHWLDDGLLPLLLTAIRVCWLWPWLQLLQRWLTPAQEQPWMPLWAIPLFLLGAASLTRATLAQTGSLRRARMWVVGTGLGVLLLTLWWQDGHGTVALWDWRWLARVGYALSHPDLDPLPLLTLLVGAGLWLQGIVDGRQNLTHDALWASFTRAFVAVVLLLLVVQLDPRGLPPNTGRWFLLMVASGLSALALSSLQLSSITGRWEVGLDVELPLNRYWLASVGVVIAAMLLVGLTIGAIVSPETVAQALGWTTVLLEWLGILIGYLFMALAYVTFLFLTPLYEWLRNRLPEAPPMDAQPMEGFQAQLDALSDPTAVTVPPAVIESARWTGLGTVLVLIIVISALALRYFRRGSEENPAETRETIFSTSLLENQLAALWQDLLGRLQRVGADSISPFLSLADEQEHRRAIRHDYQTLLAQAKVQGYPRARAQTPAEYVGELVAHFPTTRQAWEIVTEEYIAARYGQQAPTQTQAARMHQACTEILRALTATNSSTGSSTAPDPGTVNDAATNQDAQR